MAEALYLDIVPRLSGAQVEADLKKYDKLSQEGIEIPISVVPKAGGSDPYKTLRDSYSQFVNTIQEDPSKSFIPKFIKEIEELRRTMELMNSEAAKELGTLRAQMKERTAVADAIQKQTTEYSRAKAAADNFNRTLEIGVTVQKRKLEADQADARAIAALDEEYKEASRRLAEHNKLREEEAHKIRLAAVALEELRKAQLAAERARVRATDPDIIDLNRQRQSYGGGGENNTRSLNAANQAATAFRAALQGLHAQMGIYTSSTILAASVTYQLANAIRDTLKLGIEYTSAISTTSAVMEASSKEISDLENSIVRMAANSYTGILEISKGLVELGQAGLTSAEALRAVGPVLQLSLIGTMDFAKAAEIATNTMHAFGLQAKDLAGVVDIFAKAAVESNVTVKEIGTTMSYAAPVAESYGIALEDIATAIALLGNAGIVGSRAGTTLRRTIEALYTPTKKGAEALESLGVATTDAYGMSKSLEQVFLELSESTNGATTKLSELEKIVGLYALPGFLRLIAAAKGVTDENGKTTKGFSELKAEIEKAAGSAKLMGTIMMDNLGGDLKRLQAVVETVQLDIFKDAEGPLRDFVQTLSEGIKAFGANSNNILLLIDSVKEIITVIGVLIGGAALGGLFSMLGKIGGALGTFTTRAAGASGILSKLAPLLGLLASHPVARAVLTLGGAFLTLNTAMDSTVKLGGAVGDSWDKGAKSVEDMKKQVKEMATVNGEYIEDLEKPARYLLKINDEYDTQLAYVNKLKEDYDYIVGTFGEQSKQATELRGTLDEQVGTLDTIYSALQRALGIYQEQYDKVKETKGAVEEVNAAHDDGLLKLAANLTLVEDLKSIFNDLVSTISSLWTTASQWLSDNITNLGNWAEEKAKSSLNWFEDFYKNKAKPFFTNTVAPILSLQNTKKDQYPEHRKAIGEEEANRAADAWADASEAAAGMAGSTGQVAENTVKIAIKAGEVTGFFKKDHELQIKSNDERLKSDRFQQRQLKLAANQQNVEKGLIKDKAESDKKELEAANKRVALVNQYAGTAKELTKLAVDYVAIQGDSAEAEAKRAAIRERQAELYDNRSAKEKADIDTVMGLLSKGNNVYLEREGLIEKINNSMDKGNSSAKSAVEIEADRNKLIMDYAETLKEMEGILSDENMQGFDLSEFAAAKEGLTAAFDDFERGVTSAEDFKAILSGTANITAELAEEQKKIAAAAKEYYDIEKKTYDLLGSVPPGTSAAGTAAELNKEKEVLEKLQEAYSNLYKSRLAARVQISEEEKALKENIKVQQDKVAAIAAQDEAFKGMITQYGSAQRAAQVYYDTEVNKLQVALKSGAIGAKEYADNLSKIEQQTRVMAASNEMTKLLAEWGNEMQNLDKLGADWLGRFSDAIADWASGSKGAFKSFFEYVSRSLTELAARQFVVSVAGAYQGMTGSGGINASAMNSAFSQYIPRGYFSGLDTSYSMGAAINSGYGVGGDEGYTSQAMLATARNSSGMYGGGMSGMAGMGTSMAGMAPALGTMIGNWLAKDKKGGSMYVTGGTMVGTAIGSIWGPIGGMIGGAIGGVVGGLAAKLFGKTDKSKESPDIQFLARPGFGVSDEQAKAMYEDSTFIRTPFSVFGLDRDSSKVDAREYKEIFRAFKEIDDIVAEAMGTSMVSKVQEALKAAWEKGDFKAELTKNFDLKGKSQEEMNEILGAGAKQYYEQLFKVGKEAGDVFSEIMSKEMEGITGSFDEVMEKVKEKVVRLSEAFKIFNDYIKSDIVEDHLKQLEEANRSMKDTGRILKEDILKAIEDFDGTVESAEKLAELTVKRYAYELEVLAYLEAAMQDIANRAADFKEQMNLDVMDENEKYNYYKKLAEDAYAKMLTSTDPEEIKKYALLAMEYAQQAWNLLPEDMKKALKPGFDSFIDSLVKDSGLKLDEFEKVFLSDSEKLRNQLAELMKQDREAAEKTQARMKELNDNMYGVRVAMEGFVAKQQEQFGVTTTQTQQQTGLQAALVEHSSKTSQAVGRMVMLMEDGGYMGG